MRRSLQAIAASAAIAVLLVVAGDSHAQAVYVAPAPVISYYYAPPAYVAPAPVVSYYAPPTLLPATQVYYPPTPAVSYYYAPTTAYYAPAATAYYPPTTAVTTYRYGLFGPRRVSTSYYSYYP